MTRSTTRQGRGFRVLAAAAMAAGALAFGTACNDTQAPQENGGNQQEEEQENGGNQQENDGYGDD